MSPHAGVYGIAITTLLILLIKRFQNIWPFINFPIKVFILIQDKENRGQKRQGVLIVFLSVLIALLVAPSILYNGVSSLGFGLI